MVLDINIKSLLKLYHKGRIDLVYKKIYDAAEDIATYETQKYMSVLEIKKIYGDEEEPKFVIKVLNYKRKRTEHHINNMMQLLIQSKDFKEK